MIDRTEKCSLCGLNTKDYDGHDPCIAHLPGVSHACCGHGKKPGYIYFTNGTQLWFTPRRVDTWANGRKVSSMAFYKRSHKEKGV